jgi:hypothetical protein
LSSATTSVGGAGGGPAGSSSSLSAWGGTCPRTESGDSKAKLTITSARTKKANLVVRSVWRLLLICVSRKKQKTFKDNYNSEGSIKTDALILY